MINYNINYIANHIDIFWHVHMFTKNSDITLYFFSLKKKSLCTSQSR